MAIRLVRRPGVEVNFADPFASRAWIRAQIGEQIKLNGQPHPKIYLLGAGFVETFDLDAMGRHEPGANLGATFQVLRRRNNVQRCFAVIGLLATDPTGAERTFAVVFEEVDVADGRRWWLATHEYRIDPATGLGQLVGDWKQPPHDTSNPAELPPFVRELAAPPATGRPAAILDASDIWAPDLKFRFGDLPDHVNPPVDAKQMVELTAALGTVNGLLTGQLQGVVVVRITGRSWEQWVLTGDLPVSVTEMVRWIANHRLPPAEAVGIAQMAIRPEDDAPAVGVQVIGELGGLFVETWAPVEFPEGPAGPKLIKLIHWRDPTPVPADKMWIGVPSKAEFFDSGPMA